MTISRPDVVEYEPYDVYSVDQSRQEAARRAEDPSFWAVELRGEDTVIGNVWLARGDLDTWELGYVFHSGYWGRGYAAEACETMVAWAFTERAAHRIVAECNPLNRTSWRLLERLGFRREGHLLSNVWFRRSPDGSPVWQATYVYAMLAEDRRARQPGSGGGVLSDLARRQLTELLPEDADATRHGFPLPASARQPVTDELVDALRDEEGV